MHHARNLNYVDRNYGGVFILWDRLFGSFQEEREGEPVEFGILKPLASWNPLRANFHIYQAIVSDCLQARNIADKFYVWVAPTGWRPADVPAPTAPDLTAKYDPQCAPIAKTYAQESRRQEERE